ncbi:MAG: cell division protein FtsH [Dehalococcoidales bacterium]|nr:cell division protein FtsH [Dehalococcoidales bacterium]
MYAAQQFGGQQMRPQQYQYGTVGGIYPQQTADPMSTMFSSMMPMIMMIMMMSIMMPMMKGVTGKA